MFNGKDSRDLNEQIERLVQENKALALRVQGVEVLGKVLQDSQDENSKLRQDVTDLKRELSQSGVDVSQISLRTTPSLQDTRCFLSQKKDNSLTLSAEGSFEAFEMVPHGSNLTSNHGSAFEENLKSPGTPGFEFHVKDLLNGVKIIKEHTEYLLLQAQQMRSIVPTIRNPQEKLKLTQKIASLCEKLEKRAQDVNTREKLLQGLVSQQEQLKEKVHQMENEQVSQEKVMNDLKLELEDYTEELQQIQDEINVFGDAEIVNKEDISLRSMSSQSTSVSTASSHSSSHPTKKEDQAKLDSEVTVTTPSCERCFELIKQLNQAVKQKKEAERQKEEILDVNHAWDTQYKKLKAETSKEIKELKQQVEFYRTSDNQRKYEAVRNSYKKVIDDERTMKEKAMEDKRRNDEKVKELEEEIRKLSLQIREQQIQPRASTMLYGLQNSPLSSLAAQAGESSDLVKEVEVLKQQLRIYADDFKCEREDRERMQGEKEKLETELKESKERILVLEEQLNVYKEDFRKETQEKDRLRRQLLTNREVPEPENRYTEMTRKVQAVAERQAKLRALRDEYDREERLLLQDQQNLQQRPRIMAMHPESQIGYSQLYTPDRYQSRRYEPPLRPRGARPSDEMFYGGDVQADMREVGREVPDSSTNRQDDLTCPRCYRSFPLHDDDAYTNHIDRCIE